MHNKLSWDNKIRNKFKLPEKAKVIYFRHPKEVKYFSIEYINPTHKAILWGTLKKKYGKYRNIKHKIRVGKIKISFILLFNNWIEKYIYLIVFGCIYLIVFGCIYHVCLTGNIGIIMFV